MLRACGDFALLQVIIGAVVLVRWLGTWHGVFDSFYVPEQVRLLQSPSLVDLITAQKASGKPCTRHTRVVVTLSTFAGRLKRLKGTLQSLVGQSCALDAIHVFVSKNPRTKKTVGKLKKNASGDGVEGTKAFWDEMRGLGSQVNIHEIEQDWGPATKLLAALQVEKDPSTWLITVDDDTRYHTDTVLALTLAASQLPSHMAPAFWCEEAWADGYRSTKKRTMEQGEEGSVHGWCGGFAGVLFKRFMLDDQVFNFTDAPDGCHAHDDIWWGGHLLSSGNAPYLINPGFFSVEWSPSAASERQDSSVNVLDRLAKEKGQDLMADCASWFASLRGIHMHGAKDIPAGLFRHNEALSRSGQDLWVLSTFFSRKKGVVPLKGTFVEFGALDGKFHSNTNFFETHLKWRGVLAEPTQHFGGVLAQNRPGSLAIQGAVCGKSGPTTVDGVQTDCYSLEDVLGKANIQHVHYLAMSTEGTEYDILKTFPFKKYRIDLLQVEVHLKNCIFTRHGWSRADSWKYFCLDKDIADKITGLMVSNGYVLADNFVVDIGGHGRGSLHWRWIPIHFSVSMTADLIFYRQHGEGGDDELAGPRNDL